MVDVPTNPIRRSTVPLAFSSKLSCAKLMMVALGYSSSGTMNTGKHRVLAMAEDIFAKGSLSGPPRSSGSPSMGTSTAPFSNCGHQPVRYQPLAMFSSS